MEMYEGGKKIRETARHIFIIFHVSVFMNTILLFLFHCKGVNEKENIAKLSSTKTERQVHGL